MIEQVAIWLVDTDYALLDYTAMTLLLISAFMVIQARDLLAAAILLGIFSLLMAIAYLLFDAPDVALTEAAVGAGISTILFVGTVSFTGRMQKRTDISRRLAALAVTATATAALIASTDTLPPFASPEAPIHQHVAPYYLQNTQNDIGIPNVVTAILASYRGFDTLGEVAVIFIAGIGITALLMNQPLVRRTHAPIPAPPAPAPATPAGNPSRHSTTPPEGDQSAPNNATHDKTTGGKIMRAKPAPRRKSTQKRNGGKRK